MSFSPCIASVSRQFAGRRNSGPQGVGGRNADAHFPPVQQVNGAADERHDLAEVDDVVAESEEALDSVVHFVLDFKVGLWLTGWPWRETPCF